MTIYRVAWKRYETSLWQWKSTKLGTLHAVFGFLRLYHMIPVERMRVFSSFSLEDLDEQLREENEREAVLIAEQTQQVPRIEERMIPVDDREKTETLQEQRRQEQEVFVARLAAAMNRNGVYTSTFHGSMDASGKKRLEYELGAGGDHDIPYSYTPPESLPLRLAWTRLLGKVQRGELEP